MSEIKKFIIVNPPKEKDIDELIIETVKCYPQIYDHGNRQFKDSAVRETCWKEISLTLQRDVSECESRWKRLRERYTKESRGKDAGKEAQSAFIYYDHMSFLRNHIKRRRNLSRSLKRSKRDTDSSGEYDEASMSVNALLDTEYSESPEVDSKLLIHGSSMSDGEENTVEVATTEMSSPPSGSQDSPVKKLRPLRPKPGEALATGNLKTQSLLVLDPTKFRCINTVSNKNTLGPASINLRQEDTGYDKDVAILITKVLQRLPELEKQKRLQAIMNILFEPYNPKSAASQASST